MTSEKYDLVEVLREVLALLKGLDPSEQRQIMALVAERNGMKLEPQEKNSSKNFKPYPKSKTSYK